MCIYEVNYSRCQLLLVYVLAWTGSASDAWATWPHRVPCAESDPMWQGTCAYRLQATLCLQTAWCHSCLLDQPCSTVSDALSLFTYQTAPLLVAHDRQ